MPEESPQGFASCGTTAGLRFELKESFEKDAIEETSELPCLRNSPTHLPANLRGHSFVRLVDLNLPNNRLTNLPNSLRLLVSLRCLNISYNRFSRIPDAVTELTELRALEARHNSLAKVATEFANLVNLEQLDFGWNAELTGLPDSCSNLNRLGQLALNDCRFAGIPRCVSTGINRLEVFDFSGNIGSDLNPAPASRNLVRFDGSRNGKCPSFPSWTVSSAFPNLRVVRLDDTWFAKYELEDGRVPDASSGTRGCSRLREFSMKRCGLSGTLLRDMLPRIRDLEYLRLGNGGPATGRRRLREGWNMIWELPLEHVRPKITLKELDLSSLGIPMVSRGISDFTGLSMVDLAGNELPWLPDEICELHNLRVLLADKNNLTFLPKHLGRLTSIKRLGLASNKLIDLPISIESLKELEFLDLYDNEISALPKVLNKFSKLSGLDLEWNYFRTDSLPTDHYTVYKRMLAVSRDHCFERDQRTNGAKPELLSNDGNSASSKISVEGLEGEEGEEGEEKEATRYQELIWERENNVNQPETATWDTSEDSADEFDPCADRSPRLVSSPFRRYQWMPHYFCPDKLHPPRTALRRTLIRASAADEGQFDDV